MTEHYFSEAPAGDYRPREIEVPLAGATRKLVTAGGVFSPEHLDRGTEILLAALDTDLDAETKEYFGAVRGVGFSVTSAKPAGGAAAAAGAGTGADADADHDADGSDDADLDEAVTADLDIDAALDLDPDHASPAAPEAAEFVPTGPPMLDIGCGWGAIALAAALNHPGRMIWAIDVNERSRELTRINAERLGLKNVVVCAPSQVPDDIVFGEIRSNPPIRVGKDALHEIMQQWLPRLTPGGSAYLVVAKHLGADSLQKWIASEFDGLEITRLTRSKGFHVLHAVAD